MVKRIILFLAILATMIIAVPVIAELTDYQVETVGDVEILGSRELE